MRIFFMHWAALLAAAVLASTAQAQPADRPNILLIVSDDQGYHDLGCCGRPELKTPTLDRLAAEGVRLTNFYVAWPACTPSRGAILTGRYPQRNGLYDMIRNNEVNWEYQFTETEYAVSPEMALGLDLREITIGQTLKMAGYATGVVGKWDSGRARRFLPLQRGFDFFYGFCNTGVDYWTHQRYGIESMFRNNERIEEEGYATSLFEREALGFIRDHKNEPFFLYMPFNAPHGASNFDKPGGAQAPPEHIKMYGGTPPGDRRERYLGSVTAMDDSIGRMLDELKKQAILDKTLIVFFSDNGGSGAADNGPLRGRKAQMWEGGLRVPFLARWPGRIPADSVRDDFLTSLEVFPTLTAVAGGKLPEGVVYDGFDMMPVLVGNKASEREEMFWERRGEMAARYKNWKWVKTNEEEGVFNLAEDIGEKRDLSKGKPELLKMMRDRYAHWRKRMDESEPRGPFRDY